MKKILLLFIILVTGCDFTDQVIIEADIHQLTLTADWSEIRFGASSTPTTELNFIYHKEPGFPEQTSLESDSTRISLSKGYYDFLVFNTGNNTLSDINDFRSSHLSVTTLIRDGERWIKDEQEERIYFGETRNFRLFSDTCLSVKLSPILKELNLILKYKYPVEKINMSLSGIGTKYYLHTGNVENEAQIEFTAEKVVNNTAYKGILFFGSAGDNLLTFSTDQGEETIDLTYYLQHNFTSTSMDLEIEITPSGPQVTKWVRSEENITIQ